MSHETAFENSMKLALVCGMRAALGPALVAVKQRREDRALFVAASLGEMVLDKLNILPSRARLPLLLPRAAAGYWVADQTLRQEGIDDPFAAGMSAAVAAGTATLAPLVRKVLTRIVGIPDSVVGLLEDYLVLRLGCDATGLTMEEIRDAALDALGDVREKLNEQGIHIPNLPQSIGAGSM
jgi:hypothetical protein